MQNNQSDIEIGKLYTPLQLLELIGKETLGHITIENNKEITHDYYVNKSKLEKLKNDSKIKVLSIANEENQKNFAYELLEQKDIKELLEKIKENPAQHCIIEKTDLVMYDYSSISQVTKLINKVFKSKDMPYKALNSKEKIMIKYKKNNGKENKEIN